MRGGKRLRYYLIDKITEFKVGERASGIKNVTMSEDFMADHFPRHPTMPGVLILESLAQLGGLLLEYSARKEFGIKVKAILSIIQRAKFRQMVRPGDQLKLKVELTKLREESGIIKAVAILQDRVAAEAELIFVYFENLEPELEKKQRELVKFMMRDLPFQNFSSEEEI